MKSIAILQARTSSSRLPGKVLLPVGGMPLVVLAARRAGNEGRDIIVATSTDQTDDALSEILLNAGIKCFRGSLENTLQRLVGALDGYSNDALVFRLTADNVFPDGALLDEMEKDFIRRDLKYLCCNGEKSGLPYGMSAELTRVQYLREAAKSAISKYDQEHVTPLIRRRFGEVYFERFTRMNKGHLRCTVDCLDDYLAIQRVFSGITNPEVICAFKLIDILAKDPYQPQQSERASKLVLGTAQLGMKYGIVNQTGRPLQEISERLIKTAIINGVPFLDTARAYGYSEEVIGNALKSGWGGRVQVVTKLSPLLECPSEADTTTVNALVDASIYRSCTSLRTQKLNVLMLHRASHLYDWSGAVIARLLEHKVSGLFNALGVSVQNPVELEHALNQPEVEFIQMPFNLLDWRWDALIPKIKEVKGRRQLVIHVRSALLQGLLPSSESEYWRRANVADPKPVMEWLASQTLEAGCTRIADLCLRYAKSLDWVDGVVVGMETCEQLAENIQIFCGPDLSLDQVQNAMVNRPLLDEQTLNPNCWGS